MYKLVYVLLLVQTYGGDQEQDKNRMTTSRCAELIVVAIANDLSEVWIGRHPVLLFTYCMQLLPAITFRFVLLNYAQVLCTINEYMYEAIHVYADRFKSP